MKIPPLLPFHSFDIHTSLPSDGVLEVLAKNVDPVKWYRFDKNHTYFQGTYTRQGFAISRIIHYRNSFLPQITGTITPHGAGSLIHIAMRPHVAALCFMILWLTLVGTGCIVVATGYFIAKNPHYGPGALIPFGMFIFGMGLCLVGFWLEAPAQEKKLREIFPA